MTRVSGVVTYASVHRIDKCEWCLRPEKKKYDTTLAISQAGEMREQRANVCIARTAASLWPSRIVWPKRINSSLEGGDQRTRMTTNGRSRWRSRDKNPLKTKNKKYGNDARRQINTEDSTQPTLPVIYGAFSVAPASSARNRENKRALSEKLTNGWANVKPTCYGN